MGFARKSLEEAAGRHVTPAPRPDLLSLGVLGSAGIELIFFTGTWEVGGIAGAADLNWPRSYSIPCDIMLSI